jgi:type IV fimbrial biogenesis protein FimT
MLRHQRNINGYSMMELLVVIAIVSIVAALARPSVKPYLESLRLRSAANAVKQQLVLAKTRAIGDPNLHCGVYFGVGALSDTALSFFDVNSDNNYTAGTDQIFMPASVLPISDTLKIVSGINPVIFRGDGSAKYSLKICISNGYNKCDTISVLASTGRIKITKNF